MTTRPITRLVLVAALFLGLAPTAASQWSSWWNTNRESVIAHWAEQTPGRSYVGWANSLTSRGRSFLPPTRLTPKERLVVTDALFDVLATTTETTLRERLTYALARVAAPERLNEARELIEESLSDSSSKVRVAAAFALGILGDTESTSTLVGIALDDARARISLRQSIASNRVRGYAAVALGKLDSPAVLDELVPILKRDDTDDAYLQYCIVFALGMLEGERATRAGDVLRELLEDLPRDRGVQGVIPIALAKLGQPESLAPVLELLVDGKTERELRQASAVALGQLAMLEDERVVEALFDAVTEGSEGPLRWYSLMSLARIGARTPRRAQPFAHQELEARLLDEFNKPSHEEHQPWGALALAVYAIDNPTFRATAIEAIEPVYSKEKSPDDKGAYAIALGLLGARDTAKDIFDDLQDLSDRSFRGSAALSLGMLGHEPAREWMLKRALDKSTTSSERILLIRGLALMGDRGTTKAILGEWKTSGDAARRASLAAGLARLRHPGALPRLIEVATEDGATQPREEAVSVLGLHSDREHPRFNELLPEDTLGVPVRLTFIGY